MVDSHVHNGENEIYNRQWVTVIYLRMYYSKGNYFISGVLVELLSCLKTWTIPLVSKTKTQIGEIYPSVGT